MARLMEAQHPDESDLLRLVDGDGSRQELTCWRMHVDTCQACASRLELLERRSAKLSDLVAEIELPADFSYPALPVPTARAVRTQPHRGSGLQSGWLRAAALAALLLLPLVAVQPLRAAVTEWLSDRWADLTVLVQGDATPAEPQAQDGTEEAGVTLWFTPSGEELRIEIVSRQRAGTLLLRRTATREGSLQVTSGEAGETPVISEQGVRILNAPQSTASYEVGVPAGVRRVSIRIGDDPPIVLDRTEIQAGRPLGLHP
jgi:hypothetical protein